MHADVLYENGNSRTVIKNGILSHRPILIIDKRVCKDSSNSSVASSNDNDDKIILDTSESSSAGEAIIEEQHVNEFQVIFSKLEQDGKKVTLLVNINEDWVEVSLSVSNLILLQDGYRVTKAGKIKFGSMGFMTSPKCAECVSRPGYDWEQVGEDMSQQASKQCIYLQHVGCIWLGGPAPAREEGLIIRRSSDPRRAVVQLRSAPAARVARLVLVHDPRLAARTEMEQRVRVWFYTRKYNKTQQFSEAVELLPAEKLCC